MPSAKSSSPRPKSFAERSEQAETLYNELTAKFRTHKFIDWGVLTEWQEEDEDGERVSFLHAVPAYSWRFDEYLAYFVSGYTPVNIPRLLEMHFSEPDKMDLEYLEDILTELEKISAWKHEPYRCYKGSNLDVGPFLNRDYDANLVRARKWIESCRAELVSQPMVKPVNPSLSKQGRWEGLFLRGFNVSQLDKLLISLGILTEDFRHTEESRPRVWRAVVEALRVKKLLSPSNSAALHRTLMNKYNSGQQRQLPSLRAVQEQFNADNPDAQDVYQRALRLLDTF